jgi:alpha-N-arabinofuranosidase
VGATLSVAEGWRMVADHEPAVEGPEHAAKVARECWSPVDVASDVVGGGDGSTTLHLAPESWTALSGTLTRA